jgi:hypothetical protein
VAKVSVAAAAKDFRSPHEPTIVSMQLNAIFIGRRPKARPTGAGIEFGLGVEKRLAAAEA